MDCHCSCSNHMVHFQYDPSREIHGPRMLMTRNLIYTAVTRARSCVCLVGIPEMFQSMVDNETEQRRYTGLRERIREIEEEY